MMRLRFAMVALGVVVAAAAAAGMGVRASHGAQVTGDEPQYLLSALSLAEDGNLDISDELAAGRWRTFHEASLPQQTEPLPDGREVSPHDPLLPVLLALPMALGGWVGAKLALAALAGVLAATLLWTAVRRFDVPLRAAALVVGVFSLSPPFAIYGTQVYPELPAALVVTFAIVALTGPMGRAGTTAFGLTIVALPWLSVKYAPVAAVLALIGLARLAREGGRARAAWLVSGLAAAGVVFLAAHQAIYGGWTPYAAGDHFVRGEFSVVGFNPDYLGRSRRLLGLLIGRTFGLAAWQPAWLLMVPALAILIGRRDQRHWQVLVWPLATTWLIATFVALTMQGWWWPGRQVVVGLPCAVLAVASWAASSWSAQRAVAALGALGVVTYGWLVADGLAGRITWVVGFASTTNPIYRAWRLALPDYLNVTASTWILHGSWLVLLLLVALRLGVPNRGASRVRTRTLRWLALLAVLAVAAAGCGVRAGASDDIVRVYSARHYDLEEAFQEFAAETGISVEFLFGSDAELRERILAEGEDTLADVYMTVDAGNLYLAAEDGIFTETESTVLEEAIPAHLRDPQGRWFGLSQRVRTIMYNTERVEEGELSTYEALADPQWNGRLCLRNSTNLYTQSLVASLIAHHGYDGALEIVEGWVANQPTMINNDVVILETIAAGGCDVGITNHYYLARLLEETPDLPVRPFWANQDGRGVHVNTSGGGVTRWADHPEEALRLLEWLATDGQSSFVDGNFEYPANPDVEPIELIRQWGEFAADELSAAEYGSLNAEAVQLMDEAGYE